MGKLKNKSILFFSILMIILSLLGIVLVFAEYTPKKTSEAGHSCLNIRIMPYWGNLALESLSDYTTTTVYRNGTTYTSVDDNTLDDIGSFTITASSPNSEAKFTNMGTYDFLRSSNIEAKIDNDKWSGDIGYSFTVSVSPNSGFQYSKPYVVSTSANANYNSSSFTIMGNSIYLETFNQSLDYSGTLGHNIFETGTN